jgi:hypothetical protein
VDASTTRGVGVRPRSGQMIMNRGELPMRISILARIVARAPLAWRVDRLRGRRPASSLRSPGRTQSYGVSPTAELHGNALVQGTDEWLTMAPMIRARIGVYEAALDAIASGDGLHLFLCGVDRARLRLRYTEPGHPHRLALSHVLQRWPASSPRLRGRQARSGTPSSARPGDAERAMPATARHPSGRAPATVGRAAP